MKPVRGSSRPSNMKMRKKPGEKSSAPQEPRKETVRQKPSQKKKGGTSSNKSKSNGQEKWVPLTRLSIIGLKSIVDQSILKTLGLNRREKEETNKHLNILKTRLVGACAELRVPPLTRGDFETERIASQLQEEGRRSLNGKKTLSRLESDLDNLLVALEEMEEEKKPLEKSCSSLKGQLEEDKAVEMLQMAERCVLRIRAPPTHKYTTTLQAQLSSTVPRGEGEGMARRLGDILLTSAPLQDARLLLANAGQFTDGLLSTGPSGSDSVDLPQT
ncbi:unnamed protein product [Gadus morhua 'NCC']